MSLPADHQPAGLAAMRYLLQEREQLIATLQAAKAEQDRLAAELASIQALRASNQLIQIEYGYTPKCRDWRSAPFVARLAEQFKRDEPAYVEWLKRFARYIPNFTTIAVQEGDVADVRQPFWINDWLPGFDAITLYGMVVERNPRLYVEVGSGNSTKFVRKAIADHNLRTRIISIDPYPRAEIDQICDEVIRKPCEDVDLALFKNLTAEDMVFIDNSHISFMNTDVTVFFCEILGMLPKGLVFGIHDIYLPFDYPDIWKERWYNEQYLLLMYLAGGADGDKVILPNFYISAKPELRAPLLPFYNAPTFDAVQPYGGIFWLQRAGNFSV